MKRKLLFTFIILATIGAIYTIANKDTNVEKLRAKHAEFLKNHPYSKTVALSKKDRKAKGMPPNAYFEQEYLLEMNPNIGKPTPENYILVQQELKEKRKLSKVPGDSDGNLWVERGPNNVGGRTRVVLFDPNDPTHKRVFAGGVSGGLWVNNDITDANSSWTRVGIDENLSVSCITVDPNNSQIMYVGTGESYTGDDAVGNGVWKSTDGGSSWTSILRDEFNSDTRKRVNYINDILAWNNPITNKTEVFIAVARAYYGEGQSYMGDHGLWKSINDGTSWIELDVEITPGSNYIITDFEVGADNTIWAGTNNNTFEEGGGTILKSTNGSNFVAVYSVSGGRRTEIAVSKTDKNKIYALISTPGLTNKVFGLYTTNGFVNSTVTTMAQPNDADTGIPATDFTRGQAFYDLVIEVDPTDDTKVYVGGIDLFRSSNSGASWKQISKWSNNNNLRDLNIPTVHADQHSWAFHPTDANKAILGNDGGVFYASSLAGAETTTTAILARNKEYNITQFYNGAIGQNTSNTLLLSGAQDNGTQFINGANAGINSSVDVYGGDGAYSFIDKDDDYMIVSYVYNVKARLSLPYSGGGITLDNDQQTGSFINPQELDDNLDILFANASVINSFDSIIRYSNIKGAQSSVIKKRIGSPLLSDVTTALKVSPFTTNATKLFVGTRTGKLLRVDNANSANPTWTDITGGDFVGSVSSISFGKNESEILVTFHNYGVKNIWFSENGGTTWQEKEGNFPDIPVKAVMMNPLNNNEVIVGTQLGVWKTGNFKDPSPSWSQSFNGMSNVKVTSFSLRTADNTVLASTYGRGMFTGQFSAGTASVEDVIAGKEQFSMYPTVSKGDFTVFAKKTLGKSTLYLFDINGRKVFSKDLDFTTQEKQPISVKLSAGVYIVNLIGEDNKRTSGKIIIE